VALEVGQGAMKERTMSTMSALQSRFEAANEALPLVAVLRGLTPQDADAIGRTLYETGFRLLEIPLNSPDPLASVGAMRKALPTDALVGAGTVVTAEQVGEIRDRGGEMIFSPHLDVDVVRAAKAAELVCVPGVATPSEAFAALRAGADALKLFPAGDLITPRVVKAIRVVLPHGVRLMPFGGITPETMRPYAEAGAQAFGIGAALYKPGMSCDEVGRRASAFVAAWKALQPADRPIMPRRDSQPA
jgi:2-dehydro-3-deoxyphosphogalactonate aldolase